MTTNLDFSFDVLDKRFDQISFKLVTVNDRLIYARMANEFKLYKTSPNGYTPTMTALAVTGGFSDRKPVMKTFQRLKDVGLLFQHPTKPRQPLRFTVLSIDEALKVNPQLLSMPTMSERRAQGMKLESKGRKPRSVVPETTVNSDDNSSSVVPEPLVCSSRDNSTVVPETTDCSSRNTHERTIKERERSFKEDLNDEITDDNESQGQGLSRDDDSLTSKAHIGKDSDQLEESKPVVTKVNPPEDDDDYFEPDSDSDSDLMDDEELHRLEQRAEERNKQAQSTFSGKVPTPEEYKRMMSGNRVGQHKHKPAKPAWM